MKKADAKMLAFALAFAADRIIEAAPTLTMIDSIAGDGDHGEGMRRGFAAVKEMLQDTSFDTPADLAYKTGICLIRHMGGASGVLFGTLFIGTLPALENSDFLDPGNLYPALQLGTHAVLRRGRAKTGDRTMADALLPALSAMGTKQDDLIQMLRGAAEGAYQGGQATCQMLPRQGRAKGFGQRALGWPDPGAVSVYLLLSGFYAGLHTLDFPGGPAPSVHEISSLCPNHL